jgi:hypothetical protein
MSWRILCLPWKATKATHPKSVGGPVCAILLAVINAHVLAAPMYFCCMVYAGLPRRESSCTSQGCLDDGVAHTAKAPVYNTSLFTLAPHFKL